MIKLKKIRDILMERDGISSEEADEIMATAQTLLDKAIMRGDIFEAYDICEEYLGLEPDYLQELL